MKKLLIVPLVCLSLTGCDFASSNQAYGTSVGIDVGSHIGSLIGGSSRGPAGDLIGTVVGAAIGGAIGYSVTAPKAEVSTSDGYTYVQPSEHVENENYMTQEGCIEVRNLRFIDENHNKSIDPGETCKVIFDLRNVCGETVTDVVPYLTCNVSNKVLSISEAENLSSVAAGNSMSYTAYIKASSHINKSKISFTLKVQEGRNLYDARTFEVPVAR